MGVSSPKSFVRSLWVQLGLAWPWFFGTLVLLFFRVTGIYQKWFAGRFSLADRVAVVMSEWSIPILIGLFVLSHTVAFHKFRIQQSAAMTAMQTSLTAALARLEGREAWEKLRQLFESLDSKLNTDYWKQLIPLQHQWFIQGVDSQDQVLRFRALAAQAGELLFRNGIGQRYPEIRSEPDPETRWLLYLVEVKPSPFHRSFERTLYEGDDVTDRLVHWGSIPSLGQASATACLVAEREAASPGTITP